MLGPPGVAPPQGPAESDGGSARGSRLALKDGSGSESERVSEWVGRPMGF